jgi:hypothetical protein
MFGHTFTGACVVSGQDRRRVASILADALLGAMMLHPVIWRIRRSDSPDEITAIVNDAINREWLLPFQLPLLDEGILA